MSDFSHQIPCSLPDIAADVKARVGGSLQWVGMTGVEMPLRIKAETEIPPAVARIRAEVSLDSPDQRGIHMSRLYLACDRVFSSGEVGWQELSGLTHTFLESHAGLSHQALVEVDFEALIRRPALVSDNSGWRAYPVSLLLMRSGDEVAHVELGFEVTYSSTCPCSAALARQLIQQQFSQDFPADTKLDRDAIIQWLGSEEGILATPHSQRSTAMVRLVLSGLPETIELKRHIDAVEDALQTAVQAAVKREDEQAFALRNGKNLMFCEDAARRIQQVLNQDESIADFWLRVHHHESLHPHDATAETSKGIDGGL